jgi:hypothetical protein
VKNDEPLVIGAEFIGTRIGELVLHLYHERTDGSPVPVSETRTCSVIVQGLAREVDVASEFDQLHAADIRRAREVDHRRRQWCKPVEYSSKGCLLGTPGCEVEHAKLDSPIAWALKDMGTGTLNNVVQVARRRWGWGADKRTKHQTWLFVAYEEAVRLRDEGYAEIVQDGGGGMATRGLDVWRWTGG